MSLFTDGVQIGHPYWWDGVEWSELSDQLPSRTELLVIGGGYTGLSAAIAAADKGATVTVVDSGTPGKGASSVNGGMLGAHPRLSWDVLASRYGEEAADGLFAEAGAALPWIKDFIRTEGINCDFAETGRIQLAFSNRDFEGQKTLAQQLQDKGTVPCFTLESDQLASETSSTIYKGALVFPNHAGLHPAKYLLGLLESALKRGVHVVGNCRVNALTKTTRGFQAETDLGIINSDKVVLATNGYSTEPFHWFARKVFPVPSFLIATEPLPKETIQRLAPSAKMMVETRSLHSYYRVSPDGTRIIFGGRAALVDIPLAKAAARLRNILRKDIPLKCHIL